MKRRRSEVDKREAAHYLLTFKDDKPSRPGVSLEEPQEEQPSRLESEETKVNAACHERKQSLATSETASTAHAGSCGLVLEALASDSLEQLLQFCASRGVTVDPKMKDPVIVASRLLLEGGYGDEGKRSVCLLLRKQVNNVDALLKLLGLDGAVTVEELLNKRFTNYRQVYKKRKQDTDSSSPRSNPQETSPTLSMGQKKYLTVAGDPAAPGLLYNPYHTLIESVRATARVQQGALLALQNQSLMAVEQLGRPYPGPSSMNASN